MGLFNFLKSKDRAAGSKAADPHRKNPDLQVPEKKVSEKQIPVKQMPEKNIPDGHMPEKQAPEKLTQMKIKCDALKAYWKSRADDWWRNNGNRVGNAYCDTCSRPITPEQSYLRPGRMNCSGCADRSLESWNGSRDWFGAGELDRALEFYKRLNPDAIALMTKMESFGAESDSKELIASLGSEDQKIREKAIKEMILRGAAELPGLVTALKSGNWRQKGSVAAIFAEIKDPSCVQPLIESLSDTMYLVDKIKALGKIGDVRAVDAIMPFIELNNTTEVRGAAIEALKNIGGPILSLLIEKLHSQSSDTRTASAIALTVIADPQAVEALLEAVHDPASNVRAQAAMALAKIGDIRALEPLINIVKDKTLRSGAAVEALGKFGDKRALGALVVGLEDENCFTRINAIKAIVKVGGESGVNVLIKMLKDMDMSVRGEAANALDNLGWQPEDDLNKLNRYIAKREFDNCIEFGRLAVEPLIKLLRDDDAPVVRWEAAEALGELGDKAAIESLRIALNDKNENVRANARAAIAKLGAAY